MNKEQLETIKPKLVERLNPSGWGPKLKDFIMSSQMDKILLSLDKDAESGLRFTPPLKSVFTAFETCPYKDLKVVSLAQDPYPTSGIASGRAFCCANTGKLQPSLKYILQEVQRTIYKGGEYDYNPDLTHWSNQGVLLINTALTTIVGSSGEHLLLWRPFLVYLIDLLSFNNPGLIYMFFGAIAQKYAKIIPDNTYKIIVSHPASAAYKNADTWDSEEVFLEVNRILKLNNNLEIKW